MKKQKSFTQRHFSEKTGAGFTPTPLSKSKNGGKGLPSTIFFTKNGAGFTLIEILVVIAIVGILASVVTVVALKVREKARITASLQFSSTIHNVLGAYLVGEWKFEEGADGTCPGGEDVCDTSGNNNHGVWYGTGGHWEPNPPNQIPQLGKAGEFNGSNDFVNLPSIKLTTLTVEAWVYPTAANWHYVWSRRYGIGPPYSGMLMVYGSNPLYDMRLFASNCYADVGDGTGIPLNKWTHIVMTYDGDWLRGYVNGVEVSGAESGCGEIPAGSVNHYIGALDESNNFWQGLIDEVRVYEEALSSAQIQKLYAEGAMKRGLVVK